MRCDALKWLSSRAHLVMPISVAAQISSTHLRHWCTEDMRISSADPKKRCCAWGGRDSGPLQNCDTESRCALYCIVLVMTDVIQLIPKIPCCIPHLLKNGCPRQYCIGHDLFLRRPARTEPSKHHTAQSICVEINASLAVLPCRCHSKLSVCENVNDVSSSRWQ